MSKLTPTKQENLNKKMAEFETIKNSLSDEKDTNNKRLEDFERKLQDIELEQEYYFYKNENSTNILLNIFVVVTSISPFVLGSSIDLKFYVGMIMYAADCLFKNIRFYIDGTSNKEIKANYNLAKQKIKDSNITLEREEELLLSKDRLTREEQYYSNQNNRVEVRLEELGYVNELVTKLLSKENLTSKEKALLYFISKLEIDNFGEMQLPKSNTHKVYYKVK